MKPDKKLGQHFLRDVDVLQEIAAVADPATSSGVLEIGPGEGALTAFLLAAGKPVVVLDKDPRAIEVIYARFGDRVEGHWGDALEVDFDALLPPADGGQKPIVVGNLPYNVGTAIYRRFLVMSNRVSRMVLMLQKEVATRVVSEPGKKSYGLLSVLTALLGRAWKVCDVPPEAFYPRPKVHSSVILVELNPDPPLKPHEVKAFSNFVGKFFQARRKMLRKSSLPRSLLQRHGISPEQRPEQITPEAFLALFRAVSDRADSQDAGSDDIPGHQ